MRRVPSLGNLRQVGGGAGARLRDDGGGAAGAVGGVNGSGGSGGNGSASPRKGGASEASSAASVESVLPFLLTSSPRVARSRTRLLIVIAFFIVSLIFFAYRFSTHPKSR
jgi:hypothetical protein